MIDSQPISQKNEIKAAQHDSSKAGYNVVELFAGAGGMALGFEQAGFKHTLLNEVDNRACETLMLNRPNWPVLKADVRYIDFTPFHREVDVVAGGFPCQAFSVAGKREGFDNERGALFFEYARAVKEIQPKLFIAENVKGLLFHNKGKTLQTVIDTLQDVGYRVLTPRLMKAIHYRVPQLRERVFIVGVREDIQTDFEFPTPDETIYTLKDAFQAGKLFDVAVPQSSGAKFSNTKQQVLKQIPEGGNWRDLPIVMQKDYLGKFYGQGSNTQVARRLSWDKPCYTLLTKPDAKLTERCHPTETRPLTVREYARIQTFPDDWQFAGAISAQYRQIGNAVPINLAAAIAESAREFLERLINFKAKSFSIKHVAKN